MKLTYSMGWFREHRESVGEIAEQAARKLHSKGKLYTVVVADDVRPLAFMEVRLEVGFIGVNFLDEAKRGSVIFTFADNCIGTVTGSVLARKAPKGMCFLQSIIRREFDDDSDRAAFGTSYDYDFDGNCRILRENLRTREILEGRHVFDVSAHWEALPAFGQYDAFLQYDRWKHGDVKH